MKPQKVCVEKIKQPKNFKAPKNPPKPPKIDQEIDENFHKLTVINSKLKFQTFEFTVLKRYSNLKFVDSGAQGIVVSADDSVTGGKVAIKKMKVGEENARRAYREFVLMTSVQHPTIIRLLNAFTPNQSLSKFSEIYLVMELMPYSLFHIIYGKHEPGNEQPPRSYNHLRLSFAIYQMLCGIKHLHDSKISHRDLKPQNILVNENGDLKIADFGLARKMGPAETTKTYYVATRSYRAPEIILEAKYNENVDIWSIGCIIAEMINHKPLFGLMDAARLGAPKHLSPQVLELIFQTLGTPDEQFLTLLDADTARGIRASSFEPKRMEDIIRDVPDERPNVHWTNGKLRDLLSNILKINPNERFSVEDALNHEYMWNWRMNKNPEIRAMAQNSEGSPSRYNPDIEMAERELEEWKALIFEEVQRFQNGRDVFKD